MKWHLVVIGILSWNIPCQARQFPFAAEGSFAALSGFDRLLLNNEVQRELKLSAEQLLRVKEIVRETRRRHGKELETLLKNSADQRRQKASELLKKASDATLARLTEILKPEQIARLKQIELQERGVRAFSDPQVEKMLQLTDGQRAKIQAIAKNAEGEMRQILQPGARREDPASVLQKLAAGKRQMTQKAVEVLTDDQKKKWYELVGPRFEFQIDRVYRRNKGGR